MDHSRDDEPATLPGREKNKQPAVPPPSKWSDTMDEIIEQAMRDGAFDNLPGKGKPLKLSSNVYGRDTELAYSLLKNNDYTLPWIAERRAVQRQIEDFRSEIYRVWLRYRSAYRAARDEAIRTSLALGWRKRLDGWQEQIVKLNKMIGGANLKQPDGQPEILKLTLASELARIGAAEDLG